MPVTLKYPGVYIDEVVSLALSIKNAETAVPVMIGKFPKIPGTSDLKGLIRIDSYADYTALFLSGAAVNVAIEYTAPTNPDPESDPKKASVGTQVENYKTTVTNSKLLGQYAIQHYFANGGGRLYLYQLTSGDSNELAKIAQDIKKVSDITLVLCPETDESMGTIKKNDIYNAVNPLLLELPALFLIADSPNGTDKPSTSAEQTAVYYPNIITSYKPSRPTNASIAVTGYKDDSEKPPVVNNLAELEAVNKELFNEVVKQVDALFTSAQANVVLPPSAAVAGIYCRTDASRGVWKAPANVSVNAVEDLSVRITDEQQGTQNLAGINALRYFNGKGVLVWGARTMVESSLTNWLYVNVRRTFNTAERDIQAALRAIVFANNTAQTWEVVRSAIQSYLYSIWKQGGLVGATPDEAYMVRIGLGETMSQADVLLGKLNVQVGMAVARPAEFVIIEFSQLLESPQ